MEKINANKVIRFRVNPYRWNTSSVRASVAGMAMATTSDSRQPSVNRINKRHAYHGDGHVE